MLYLDLIILICQYMDDYNYYFLNKSFFELFNKMEKGIYWKQKYDNFFKNINKEYLILKGDYNWKREYIRIMRFNYWSKLENKSYLFLPNSEIREIPKEIGNLINLKSLNLCNNKIREIPREISNLVDLNYLYLLNNKITQIPKEIEDLNNLQYLDLSGNEINRVPRTIGNLVNLDYLYCLTDETRILVNLKYLNIPDDKIKEIITELKIPG